MSKPKRKYIKGRPDTKPPLPRTDHARPWELMEYFAEPCNVSKAREIDGGIESKELPAWKR